MKRLLLLFLLLSQIATGQIILKVGTNGYVTINGANYTRGYLGSRYLVIGTDSTLGINVNSSFPKVLYAPVHCTSYLDGDHSNTPFASMAALRTWMNAHFEFVDTSHGGGGADSSIYATRHWSDSMFLTGIYNLSTYTNVSGFLFGNGDGLVTVGTPVTSVTAGTGLSGGTITSTGTISMPNVGTAGTYGSATQVPVLTTDAQGRVTSVTNTVIHRSDTTLVFTDIIFTTVDPASGTRTFSIPSGYTKVISVTLHDTSNPPGTNENAWVYDTFITGTTLSVSAWATSSGGSVTPPGDSYNVTVTIKQ